MSIGTKEDAQLMGKIGAEIILSIPPNYRVIAIGGFFTLQICCIYYLHKMLS